MNWAFFILANERGYKFTGIQVIRSKGLLKSTYLPLKHPFFPLICSLNPLNTHKSKNTTEVKLQSSNGRPYIWLYFLAFIITVYRFKALKHNCIYNIDMFFSRKKGFKAFIHIYHKSFDWLILRILHQSLEIEIPTGH